MTGIIREVATTITPRYWKIEWLVPSCHSMTGQAYWSVLEGAERITDGLELFRMLSRVQEVFEPGSLRVVEVKSLCSEDEMDKYTPDKNGWISTEQGVENLTMVEVYFGNSSARAIGFWVEHDQCWDFGGEQYPKGAIVYWKPLGPPPVGGY